MQALLLRFLETGELQPVGGLAPTCSVNTRVICATNRTLLERVEQGEFRRDLYYRLNVVHLVVPPLRERREDIPPLVEHFARVYGDRYHRRQLRLAPDAMEMLVEYSWPGNVRELKNVIERVVVRSRSDVVTAACLPREIMAGRVPMSGSSRPTSPSPSDALLHRMLVDGESFWAAVYPAFLNRDLTRDDLRTIVQKGLERTRGNYRVLIELFNMPAKDYRRFLNLLRKHSCQQPFQPFRTAKAEQPEPAAVGPGRVRIAG
jgi:DNA-binding NtrC family response regulator